MATFTGFFGGRGLLNDDTAWQQTRAESTNHRLCEPWINPTHEDQVSSNSRDEVTA